MSPDLIADIVGQIVGQIVAREREARKADLELAAVAQKLALAEFRNEIFADRLRWQEAAQGNDQRIASALGEVHALVADVETKIAQAVHDVRDDIVTAEAVRAIADDASRAALGAYDATAETARMIDERLARLPQPEPIREETISETRIRAIAAEVVADKADDLTPKIVRENDPEQIARMIDERLMRLPPPVVPEVSATDLSGLRTEILATIDKSDREIAGEIAGLRDLFADQEPSLSRADIERAINDWAERHQPMTRAELDEAIRSLPRPTEPRSDEALMEIVTTVLRAQPHSEATSLSRVEVEELVDSRLASRPQPEPQRVDPAILETVVSQRLAALPMPPNDDHIKDLASVVLADQQPAIEALVQRHIAAIPPPAEPVSRAVIAGVVAAEVAAMPQAPSRSDIVDIVQTAVRDADLVSRPDVEELIGARIAALPAPAPVEIDRGLIDQVVAEQVATLPKPADGRDGRDGRDGKDGEPGAPGKFPIPTEWRRGVHYEAAVVTHRGSTWCATRDTAEEPPHEDWIVVAAAGAPAEKPYLGQVRGLFNPDDRYRQFDIVAFNGAEWRAKRDDPGPIPGPGWALGAAQGRQGKPGARGEPGPRGAPGATPPAQPKIAKWLVRDYLVAPLMTDDTSGPELDLRPIFEKYHDESGG